ncbi:SapC family protein [Vreelandella lionensis]|uniref:SapC family protein n=1 Tax=Vreelandella lionensis TaxID=1144478 RepID=UPI00111C3A1D|nr:SapC family protein [Halomonas lionensis]
MRLSPDLHADLRLTPIDIALLATKQRVIDLLFTDIPPLASRFPVVISVLP